ncbi:hypothetical protein K502DRAFT_339257 [Neoconidiobolus thromboides FSU 785]|nr:hypothetical protein K502DRAFT_339257 [Neoconidiobolus thromboides FSU 785]
MSKRPLQHEREYREISKNYKVDKKLIDKTYHSKKNLKTELDIIKEQYRFLPEDEEDEEREEGREEENKESLKTWEKRVYENYNSKLYREYCLANLKYYKEGKIALRWRTETEVISRKGEKICGNLDCGKKKELRKWEVDFAFFENGEKKNALVKVTLCKKCSKKLNYKKEVGKKVDEEDENRREGSRSEREC